MALCRLGQNKIMVRQQLLIKYYFIIIMATKSGKNSETMNVRTTRRSKKLLHECQVAKENARCVSSQESIDNHNQMSQHNQQQQKLKVEKQTAPPLNNDILPNANNNCKIRPNTRSSAQLPNKNHLESDRQHQQYTPEDNIINKIEEQPTSKKLIKVRSSAELSQEFIHDKNLTLKKVISKQSEIINSPYSQFRKSYRKQHKRQIISLPYRKCHDILEGRIVTIINKIESGKNCLRDFESLIDKMHKISSKDLMNRFIVGGIKTIISIALEKNIYDPKIICKLQQQSKRLEERILQELDNIKEYEGQHEVKIKCEQNINRVFYKSMYMKKMYKILKKKQPTACKNQVKQRIVHQCGKLFEGEINLSFLVRCLKNKLQL